MRTVSHVSLDNPDSVSNNVPGFGYVDITFPKHSSVDIKDVKFKNFYTHRIQILSRKSDPQKVPASDESAWRVNIPWLTLMPDAHSHKHSESQFSLKRRLNNAIKDVTHLRIYLQQPSFIWKVFRIDDVKVFGLPSGSSPAKLSLPSWFQQLNETNETKVSKDSIKKQSLEDLSSRMQELMACLRIANECQEDLAIKKYDVDGCYDINVLSHSGK